MALSENEKDLIVQALQLYLQQAGMQLPPQSMQQLVTVVKGIIPKLDNLPAGGDKRNSMRPAGISEEWFEKVCQECAKLSESGCTDKITVKFPGKCDPILKYERTKPSLQPDPAA